MRAVVVLIALALPGAAFAQTKFTMDVSPRVGAVEDRFTVTVQIEMPGVSGPDRYWHPLFPGFNVVDSTEPLKNTQSITDESGRHLTTSIIRTYVLSPIRPGTLGIGPARMRVGKIEYKTDVEYVLVNAPGATANAIPAPTPSATAKDPTASGGVGAPGFVPPDPGQRADVFLYAVADRSKVYVGQQVIVTWLLYSRTEILRWEPKPPRLDGLWSETLYEPKQRFVYFEDRVGSVPYQVVIVAKRALFPTAPGKIVVSPFVANVASLSTALGRKVRVASNPIAVEVEALPDGAPPAFDPTYVGSFLVEASADRAEIDASESLTLTLRVKGTGAIRRTTPPKLNLEGFEFREPRDFQETVDTDGNLVKGERVYRYWTTPKKGGAQEIPSIELTFFDPGTGRYEAARTQPIPLVVRGDPTKLAEADKGPTRDNVIAKDIRLIRDEPALSARSISRAYRTPWFWLLAGLPPLSFAMVVIIDRVRAGLRKETPRGRMRRARGRARQRFRVAEIHLRGNRPAKFFGELSRVLCEHIEERVGRSIQSMTRPELLSLLTDKGFTESTIKQIEHDLEAFDQARFAPSASGMEEMREALRKTRNLLRQIERIQVYEDEPVANAAGRAR